jgi:hypothetical protein
MLYSKLDMLILGSRVASFRVYPPTRNFLQIPCRRMDGLAQHEIQPGRNVPQESVFGSSIQESVLLVHLLKEKIMTCYLFGSLSINLVFRIPCCG